MRLNAYLAKAGVASRRGADGLIKTGKVTVNGRVGQLNDGVSKNDTVVLNGKVIKLQQNRYILLNKPAGYITTLKDPHGRRKITDLIDISERIVPVGRLDYDTTGVILLTNDGELAHKLMHPSFKINKIYQVKVSGNIGGKILNKLSNSIMLEDSPTAPAKAKKLSEDTIELTIHEGRNHQVKRMLAAVGLPVQKLHRSKYGSLDLTGLKPGQWRDLTEVEILKLK